MTEPRTVRGGAKGRAESLRPVFVALLVVWCVVPILVRGNLAQDAVPVIAAGKLVRSDPSSIYPSVTDPTNGFTPAFGRLSCELSPPTSDCENTNTAYVSSPLALPIGMAIAVAGGDGGVLLMRVLAAAGLVAGMWALWCRLASRSPQAAPMLVASALLLTPFAVGTIVLGQTTPWLFLLAIVGAPSLASTRGRTVASAALFVACSAFKVFPLVGLGVAVWYRRWRWLGVTFVVLGALAAVTLGAAPVSLFGDFVHSTSGVTTLSRVGPFNHSVDVLVYAVGRGVYSSTLGLVLLLAARAAVAVAGWVYVARRGDEATAWSYAYAAVLLVLPLVWGHYLWLGFAAIAVAVSGTARPTNRQLAVLPAYAACLAIVAIAAQHELPVGLRVALVLLPVVVVPVLVAQRPAVRAPADPARA